MTFLVYQTQLNTQLEIQWCFFGLSNKITKFPLHNLDFPNTGRHISFISRLVLTMSGCSWSREETPSIFMVISSSSAMTAKVLA